MNLGMGIFHTVDMKLGTRNAKATSRIAAGHAGHKDILEITSSNYNIKLVNKNYFFNFHPKPTLFTRT